MKNVNAPFFVSKLIPLDEIRGKISAEEFFWLKKGGIERAFLDDDGKLVIEEKFG